MARSNWFTQTRPHEVQARVLNTVVFVTVPHGKGALEAAAAVIGASGGPNAVATETEPVSSSSGVDMVKVRGKL